MQVMEKPKPEGDSNSPSQPSKGLLYGKGRENKIGYFAGRFAFVVVGTMFVVMVLFSFLMLWVSMNEPLLTPYVNNDKLYQDKIFLQVDGETSYRELVIVTQPGDYDQREITQIPAGKTFTVIFSPKQLEVPENYFINYLDGPNKNQEPAGGFTRQAKFLKERGFYSLTVVPVAGVWPEGRYVIDAPSGGMFGGRFYAYFTVGTPS